MKRCLNFDLIHANAELFCHSCGSAQWVEMDDKLPFGGEKTD